MKRKIIFYLSAAFLIFVFLSGCGAGQEEAVSSDPSIPSSGQVAGAEDMAPTVELDTQGLTPIYGDSLKDGIYDITVDSSSSMFRITSCTLTVEDGEMTAAMTMSGTGYRYLYMGAGREAAAAGADSYIPFAEENGAHIYTVPVEALDSGIACAAFSKNKEMWYDRTLIFRSDSLPLSAFADGVIATAESLGLTDGSYTVEVTLSGGSGKVKVESPARLMVENGLATAAIVWSSPNYDYMKVDGVRYDPESTEGNSIFVIPVRGFDFRIPVLADTIAMSTPHEIEYTLCFDSAAIRRQS